MGFRGPRQRGHATNPSGGLGELFESGDLPAARGSSLSQLPESVT